MPFESIPGNVHKSEREKNESDIIKNEHAHNVNYRLNLYIIPIINYSKYGGSQEDRKRDYGGS